MFILNDMKRCQLRSLGKIVQDNPIDKRELEIAEALIKKYSKIIKKKIEAEKSMTNVHHILPRSRGGSDNKVNKQRMNLVSHEDHHKVFNNKTPTEQIIHGLILNEQVLSKEFLTAMMGLIAEY